MKESLQQNLQALERWLLQQNRSPLPPLEKLLKRIARISFAVLRDLSQGRLTLYAMSLVYTTILSTVPLLALCFSVLKAFNVQDRFTPMLYQFLAPMGDKGLEIHSSILDFVSNMKVGLLGALGLVMLLYTVISLIQKIETALNEIWYAPGLRSLGKRVSHYLSAILLGPILTVLAISLTAATLNSSLVQSLGQVEPFGALLLFISKLVPFITVIGAFSFFYMLMPNTKVNASSALVGASIAGIFWQVISLAFASFVVSSTKYDAIYSGFAVGIILLIWIYVNWLVLLLGSSIAFYFQNDHYITQSRTIDPDPVLLERLALEIMVQVATRFEAKDAQPLSLKEAERAHFLPGVVTRRVVNRLLEDGLLLVVEDGQECLVPGHSTDQITVFDIYQSIRRDAHQLAAASQGSRVVSDMIARLDESGESLLKQTYLRDLIQETT